MIPLFRLLQLSASERRLLVRTTLLVAAVRTGLWLLPFGTLRRLLARRRRSSRRAICRTEVSAARIVRFVAIVSACIPDATCLTQAISAVVLLTRYGYASTLRIGVMKTGVARLSAHAWVDLDGRIVIGELPDMSCFTVLGSRHGDIL